MKQGLEDVVKKLTSHCEGLKAQIRDQKKLNDDVAKERDFLKGKAEQLEADVDRFYNDKDELDGIRNRLVGTFSDNEFGSDFMFHLFSYFINISFTL